MQCKKNEFLCVWLCYNKTLFIKTNGGPELAMGHNFLTPWPTALLSDG